LDYKEISNLAIQSLLLDADVKKVEKWFKKNNKLPKVEDPK